MSNKKNVYSSIALVAVLTLALAAPALADNNSDFQINGNVNVNNSLRVGQGMMNRGNSDGKGRGGMMRFAISGTVSAVNGNTITVTSMVRRGFDLKEKEKENSPTTTTTPTPTPTVTPTPVTVTYTVDATNAKVFKNNVAGTVASILVGDTVMVQGALTGSNVVATVIRDGVPLRGNDKGKLDNNSGQGLPNITGNGQPIVLGTVSAITGNTLTVTNKSNVTYTVDATNAKITQGSKTALISNIAVGDAVIVQGAVNGNAVVASTIIDQAKPANTNGDNKEESRGGGFFGGIGSFFAHLFGF